jgi:RNA polymerase sigma-70 factor, ECF subfamily
MNSDGIAYVSPILSDCSELAPSESITRSVEQTEVQQRSSSHLSHSDPSDEFLLTEAGNGSKDALGLLFRRHRRTVSNVALRILKDTAEAEDLCQEVFLLLFQKAKLFDASKGTAASWIIQITYHRAMNRRQYLTFRQHYSAEQLNEEQIAAKYQPLFIDEIVARTLLDRVREQLSADQRHTLELHFFEGYSLREIAEKTSQTLGNIRHHYYRGLECLRSNVFPQKDA